MPDTCILVFAHMHDHEYQFFWHKYVIMYSNFMVIVETCYLQKVIKISLDTWERYNPAGNYLLKVNNTLILYHIYHTYICKLLSLSCPVAGHELFSVIFCCHLSVKMQTYFLCCAET